MVRRILVLGGALAWCSACSSTVGDASPASITDVVTPAPVATAPPATLGADVAPLAADDPYCVALGSMGQLDAVQRLAGGDPAEVATAVDVATAAVGQMALVSPDAVRADWTILASAYTDLFDAFRGSGFDLTELMTDPSASLVFERFGGREVLDAGDRVEQHAEAACGVSLGLGRSAEGDEPTLAATDTTVDGPTDDEAVDIGRRLLEEFGLTATPEQQRCLGHEISDPEAIAALGDAASGSGLDRYRALASNCGIDVSSLG